MSSYRKELLLTLGPISTQVDLHTVKEGERSDLRRLCPEHHQPVQQAYTCPEGGHKVTQWVTGQPTAGGWIVVPDDRPQFEADDSLTLIPVPAVDLEANTFYGDAIYYAQPSSVASHLGWSVLKKVTETKKVALVAQAALRRGGKKLWHVTLFRDYLVMRELVFPEAIKGTPEQISVTVDRATQKLVSDFVNALLVPWDQFDTTDERRAKIEAWIASGELVAVKPTKVQEHTGRPMNVIDLQTALRNATEKSRDKT